MKQAKQKPVPTWQGNPDLALWTRRCIIYCNRVNAGELQEDQLTLSHRANFMYYAAHPGAKEATIRTLQDYFRATDQDWAADFSKE